MCGINAKEKMRRENCELKARKSHVDVWFCLMVISMHAYCTALDKINKFEFREIRHKLFFFVICELLVGSWAEIFVRWIEGVGINGEM